MSKVRRKQEYMAELIDRALQNGEESRLIMNAAEVIQLSKGMLKSTEEVQ